MTLDQRLRDAADDAHRAVSGRRLPLNPVSAPAVRARRAVGVLAALAVVTALAVTSLVMRGGPTVVPVGSAGPTSTAAVLGLFPQQGREWLDELGCRNPDSIEEMVASAEATDGRTFQFWVTKASDEAAPNGHIIVTVNADGWNGFGIGCGPPNESEWVYATSEIWAIAPNEISAEGALASVIGRVPAGAATARVTFSDGSSSDIAVQADGYFLGLVSRPDITIPNEPTPTIDDPAFNVSFPEPVHVAAFAADGTLIAEDDV